jgi:hypothetical protein
MSYRKLIFVLLVIVGANLGHISVIPINKSNDTFQSLTLMIYFHEVKAVVSVVLLDRREWPSLWLKLCHKPYKLYIARFIRKTGTKNHTSKENRHRMMQAHKCNKQHLWFLGRHPDLHHLAPKSYKSHNAKQTSRLLTLSTQMLPQDLECSGKYSATAPTSQLYQFSHCLKLNQLGR